MKDTEKNKLLQRIVHYLMLHGSFCDNIGLLDGKTGVALFFFNYARYMNNKLYSDFASELIDDIYKEIHLDMPHSFKNGLSGIAWGIEWFIRNGFVEGDPDGLLEDLDMQIMERNVLRITDISLDTGLRGLACYAISRRANRPLENPVVTQEYIADLISSLQRHPEVKNEDIPLINNLKSILSGDELNSYYNPVNVIVKNSKFNPKKMFDISNPILGLDHNGLAGVGLYLMQSN